MIKPMLATGAKVPTENSPDMLWEIKHDGIRLLPHVRRYGDHYLQARSGTDKTATFPEIHLETKVPAILDSEVVSATGLRFQDCIQKRMNRIRDIESFAKELPAKLVVFDILEVDGENIEHLSLMQRKLYLADTLIETDNVEFGSYTRDAFYLWHNVIIPQGLEGMVGKARTGQYVRNARRWLKVKAWKRNYGKDSTGETFMIVGYTKGIGWRAPTFGALEIARLEADNTLTYVGEAGTGMDRAEISGLMSMFSPSVCPWPKEPEQATWVKPFAIYVQYLEYSNDGIMRFPSFKGVV